MPEALWPARATREELLEARMSELCHHPRSPEAEALVGHLLALTLAHEAEHHPRRHKWRDADLKALEQGLGAFAADLLIHAGNVASRGTMYRGSNRAEFSMTLCSSRHFERLVCFWSELDWIEVYPGFRQYGDFDGDKTVEMAKQRRLRATPVFLGIAAEHDIAPDGARKHFSKNHAQSFPVEVKSRSTRDRFGNKRSKRLKPPKSHRLDRTLDQMRDLNRFLEEHSFSLEEVPQFKRTFHNGDDPSFDYEQGGRLYCTSARANYQKMHKEERLEILIDGEPCAEVDVSTSFLAIAHWHCGELFDPLADLYAINGIEREVVKKMVVARLASDDWPKRWPEGFKDEYQEATGHRLEQRYKLKDVVAKIGEEIPILDQIDQSRNGWAQLQYWESEAILDAIMDLKDNHGTVALPIHDSLLVPRSQVVLAKEALDQSYHSMFGFHPRLKVRGYGGFSKGMG